MPRTAQGASTVRPALRVGFIGDGAVGRSLRHSLSVMNDLEFTVAAILVRRNLEQRAPYVLDIADLVASRPDVVIECAGHDAVRQFGEIVLRAGTPLVIISVGSLADDELLERLKEAAQFGRTRMLLPAGAIGGIDALAAARLGGLKRVCYVGRKPPQAWRGTAAEKLVDLGQISAANAFFRGSARQAALLYPKNANVAAITALAGVGFDDTEVTLVADPSVTNNVHELMFEGADGSAQFSMQCEPSPDNPKTSALAAHSIARVVRGLATQIVI